MKNSNILHQVELLRDPGDSKSNAVATMPLIIILPNGIICQTTSIRGAVSIIIGPEYLDAEDASMEWHHRLIAARKQAMFALERGLVAVVYDPAQGVIPNNFAAGPNDPDYEIEPDEMNPENIYIQNDRLFLLSLIKIGAIIIYEREDSFQLSEHETWRKLKQGQLTQNCNWCVHSIDNSDSINGGYICPIYNLNVSNDDGANCCSFAFSDSKDPSSLIYPGGTYLDVSLTHDLNKLFDTVGQSWIVPNVTL